MKHLLIFAIFISKNIFAMDGVVTVLQAPLLKMPSYNSKVMQVLRNGDRVFIPNEYVRENLSNEFIQTFDRAGNTVYIPSKYVKIITNTTQEYKTPLHALKHDPTDYRLEEPIPSTYPFDNTLYGKASFSLEIGNNPKSPYEYNSNFNNQNLSYNGGLRIAVINKAKFDPYDRFYFGILTEIASASNKITFANSNTAKENRSAFKLGPIFVFDAYRGQNRRLGIGTGFTYNFHRSMIEISGTTGSEQRLFSGFSLSPFATLTYQFVNVFPDIDFVLGTDLKFNLPHSEKSSDEPTMPELWGNNSSNEIKSRFNTDLCLFFGMQFKY